MKLTLLISMTGSLALTACQTAAPSGPPDRFGHADGDGNGTLSRNEVARYLGGIQFDAADKNRNGKLTFAEWNPAGTESGARVFRAADKNGDGIVTFPEAGAFSQEAKVLTEFFTTADRNKDGALSREEVRAYYAGREGPPR
jgi:Ca2+-binding EF-hand superfamily protein